MPTGRKRCVACRRFSRPWSQDRASSPVDRGPLSWLQKLAVRRSRNRLKLKWPLDVSHSCLTSFPKGIGLQAQNESLPCGSQKWGKTMRSGFWLRLQASQFSFNSLELCVQPRKLFLGINSEFRRRQVGPNDISYRGVPLAEETEFRLKRNDPSCSFTIHAHKDTPKRTFSEAYLLRPLGAHCTTNWCSISPVR
jgi:hypothetical protein